MKQRLFYSMVAVAILCVILGVYYLIPNIYHFVGYSNHWAVTRTAHRLYSGAFFLLAVIGLIVALVLRPKQASKVA